MREVELTIIGAGPDGICAAIEAAKSNMPVSVIDENQLGKDYIQGEKLIEQLQRYNQKSNYVEGALVWGIFEDNEVAFLHKDKNERLKTQRLILAEGAFDRPLPFPGWTLPGVLTAGAALRMDCAICGRYEGAKYCI